VALGPDKEPEGGRCATSFCRAIAACARSGLASPPPAGPSDACVAVPFSGTRSAPAPTYALGGSVEGMERLQAPTTHCPIALGHRGRGWATDFVSSSEPLQRDPGPKCLPVVFSHYVGAGPTYALGGSVEGTERLQAPTTHTAPLL
jgi:hypothetical protein